MYKKYGNKFLCFSPPVMLATFVIEFALLVYTLWRYKLNNVSRLVALILGTLGIFQLAEYMICGGLGLEAADWSRVGYASISLLPALGMHLVTVLAGKRLPVLVGLAYATTAAFTAYFILTPGAVNIHECRPNYAVFDTSQELVLLYSIFYTGWLFTGIGLAWRWARQSPKRAKALYSLIAGYLVFMVPTAIVSQLDSTTMAGIPSIMCGFAILLAVILVRYVMPAAGHPRASQASHVRKQARP